MAYTEFYCQSGGSNLNSGSTTGNTATYTSTNGNWNGTTIFTPTDGSTPASSVNVGDFASIYLDAATSTVSVSRVTAVAAGVNGAITVSTTARMGTVPTSLATGRSIKVGGAFKGPNGTDVTVPLGLSNPGNATDASTNRVRINMAGTFSISTGITGSSFGNATVQGYTSTAGDGGKATIDTTTNAITAFNTGGVASLQLVDLIFATSATTGTADLVAFSGNGYMVRCVVHGARGNGINFSNGGGAIETEVYACNKSNSVSTAGIKFTGVSSLHLSYCYIHDNTGSNTIGVFLNASGTTNAVINNTIFDTNAAVALSVGVGPPLVIVQNCDFYNNGSDAIQAGVGALTGVFIWSQNNNFLKNTGGAFNMQSAGTKTMGFSFNDGYGSGTQANGADTLRGIVQSGLVTYPSGAVAWVNPANGDFRVILGAAIAAGRGAFTQTDGTNTGTVGYPDIGAAQHADIAGGIWRNGVIWLPDGFVGRHYNHKWDSPTDFIMSISSGSLPAGLSLTQLDSSSWQIDGTPTTAGAYTFDILFGGSDGFTDTFHITINTAIGQVSYGFNG